MGHDSKDDRAKILWDTDGWPVVDKQRKKAIVMDVAIPNDGNISKEKHKAGEKQRAERAARQDGE